MKDTPGEKGKNPDNGGNHWKGSEVRITGERAMSIWAEVAFGES